MTDREKILELARKAGFDAHDMSDDFTCNLKDIAKFAELFEAKVRADEREECAHIAEDWDSDLACPLEIADAIRARGER